MYFQNKCSCSSCSNYFYLYNCYILSAICFLAENEILRLIQKTRLAGTFNLGYTLSKTEIKAMSKNVKLLFKHISWCGYIEEENVY